MAPRRWKILLLQGANMNYLGKREPALYGTTTAADLDRMMLDYAEERGVDLEIFYTNIEGEALNRIYAAADEGFDGLLMNPAGLQYAGFALRDCLAAVKPTLPYIEVHITHKTIVGGFHSLTAEHCQGFVLGFGTDSYYLGFDGLLRLLNRRARVA
ncbi:type II 3-dehydroquinate dehydratase [Bosea sp. NPDC055594]